MNRTTLDDYINKRLKDSEFKKEWIKSESQYQLTRQLIKARLEKDLSQRKLAQKANTTQTVISRVENMSVNPSLRLLDKVARALGKRLEVKLVGA